MIHLNETKFDLAISHRLAMDIFYRSLCNAYGTGYSNYWIGDIQYDTALEDVLVKIIKNGYTLRIIDSEDDTQSTDITLDSIYENAKTLPIDIVVAFIQEQDDAETGDTALQHLAFGQHIYS
jgi:hypothetical protein